MRPDSHCLDCGRPVKAVLVAGKRAFIDPRPVPLGVAWVDHYQDGKPVMVVAAHPEAVPRNVPIRYTLHSATCRNIIPTRRRHLP